MIRTIRKLLLRWFWPLIDLLSRVDAPKRGVNIYDYYTVDDLISEGDILLSRSNWSLVNLFIPTVIESTRQGVHYTDLATFMLTKDKILVRSPKVTEWQAEKVVFEASRLIGRKYDKEMRTGNEAFYCFELLWWAFERVRDTGWIKTKELLGESTVTGDDLQSSNKFKDIIEVGK